MCDVLSLASRRTLGDEAVETPKSDWSRLAAGLPEKMKTLTENDLNNLRHLANIYCQSLLDNLHDRFPQPEVLSAFRLFDPKEIPLAPEDRDRFVVAQLDILLDKFGAVIEIGDEWRKIINDYQLLKDRLVKSEFEFCKNAADVCTKLTKDDAYGLIFPELQRLASIALMIPLSTAWPERGFSTLARIKTKLRNRLLDSTLCALINVSMNGPSQLLKDDAAAIADKWLNHKNRREVTKRGIQFIQASAAAECADDDDGDYE